MINQVTAEKIGVAIDFKVLINAEVVGMGDWQGAEHYSLQTIVKTALEENLQIKDEAFNLAIQKNQRKEVNSAFKPQLAAGASRLKRKDDGAAVLAGFCR